jgi:putative transposase
MLKVVRDGADGQAEGLSLGLDVSRVRAHGRMLVVALEAEVASYLERHRDQRDDRGHALVVRNGKAQPLQVTVGSGTVEITAPRVNDRRVDADGTRQRFTSAILPPYMRRSPKVVRDVWPETREQRDWVHRIANVLDKLRRVCSRRRRPRRRRS